MIYKKLLEIQRKNITVEKDGTNPHFRSTYVTLNEVLEKIKKPLNDAGIVIIQTPELDGLATILCDTEDDTFIKSIVPYTGATDMQKLGGAITYARRYSLLAMLGLEDEDDDGNTASKPAKKTPSISEAVRGVGDMTKEDIDSLEF